MKRPILPCLLILFTWLFHSSCSSVKEPELIGIENVRIDRMGLQESAVKLDLHYFNPNKFRLKLKKAEGDAWLDGNSLGHFTLDTLIHIPARDSFRLPLKLKMDMRHFLANMRMAISGKEVFLKVDGIARAGKSIVYVNYPIKYEGKVKLDELMK